ncbi:MAG: DUF1361 domain-containing protein [Anaerolineales bacterium]|jgi:uncharacterized membrane protein
MQTIAQRFTHNKYRLTIFGLLAGASVFCVALLRLRASLTGSIHYSFLIWNLFLAWIPFGIAYVVYTTSIRRRWLYAVIPVSAFLWLIFFPNAPYILTDFQHLSYAGNDIPVWYDVILLIWFSFTGLFLGMVSLFLMQEVVRREFGRWFGWGFVVLVAALTTVGIYMGRFLRWNSWDILGNPGGLAQFTLYYLINPTPRSLVFFSLFTPFFLFIYLLLYAFGHLLLERTER